VKTAVENGYNEGGIFDAHRPLLRGGGGVRGGEVHGRRGGEGIYFLKYSERERGSSKGDPLLVLRGQMLKQMASD
jgi:hypothetical protein